MHSATDIDLIHTQFLRRLLSKKKSTNLAALYGETGRYPLETNRKIIMLKFWFKILYQGNNSLVENIYLMLKRDIDANRNYNGKNWNFKL